MPANRCGLVIGRGGESIKFIQDTSGAHLELDRDGPQDGPTKTFILTGSKEQVEHAKRLIEEKVASDRNRGPPPGR